MRPEVKRARADVARARAQVTRHAEDQAGIAPALDRLIDAARRLGQIEEAVARTFE